MARRSALAPSMTHRIGRGDLQAAFAQADQQLAGQGGVLGGPLHQRQRVLGAVNGDAQGDHAGVLAEVHAVDQQAHQVQRGQVGAEQFGQRGVGHGDKAPGDRRLRGP